jgi:hypothetical protein
MSNPRHPAPHRPPVKKHESPAPPPPADKPVPPRLPIVRIRLPIRPLIKPPAAKAATPAKVNVGFIIENKTYINYLLSLAIT